MLFHSVQSEERKPHNLLTEVVTKLMAQKPPDPASTLGLCLLSCVNEPASDDAFVVQQGLMTPQHVSRSQKWYGVAAGEEAIQAAAKHWSSRSACHRLPMDVCVCVLFGKVRGWCNHTYCSSPRSIIVVVRALYVFDDPLFWLSRNWRSKKILQNTVLRKGANLKKGQISESGFSAFFRIIMMARHKITVPRSVLGSVCIFQYVRF